MNKIKRYILLLIFAQNVFAANAPVQRLDLVNVLWNDTAGIPGLTDTAVHIDFDNGGAFPCFKVDLGFKASITVWAGQGNACVKPINQITVSALPNPDVIYEPAVISSISSGYYASLITISQNTAPIFDPSNGAILASGTLKTIIENHLRNYF